MKQLSLILAAVFIISAVLFWTGHFPTIPVIATPGPHPKHSILSVILALLCLIWYRFQSQTPTR